MMRTTIAVGVGVAALLFSNEASAQWEAKPVAGVDTRVYTPAADSPAGEGKALMIVLHGCTQTADHIATHGNLEGTADAMGVVMAVPNVPLGGVVSGCWDYYGAAHTRTSGHNGPVVALAEALRDDPSYSIDSGQVYIVGFSSGGGQALILGCVAPDVFAGVGVAAAPGLGTSITEIPQVATTGPAAADLCTQYAGPHASELRTQLGVTFVDQNDFTVAQGYAPVNAEMFALVMSDGLDAMSTQSIDLTAMAGVMANGTGQVYADSFGPRVALLQSVGVGHNWPAGSGSGGGGLTFVAPNGLDFGRYLAEFFAANSMRVEGSGTPPGGSDDGGDDSGGGTSGDDGSGDEGGDESSGGGPGDGSSASGGGSGGSSAGGAGSGSGEMDRIEPSGCQCRTQNPTRDTNPTHWLAVLVVALLGRRRGCAAE